MSKNKDKKGSPFTIILTALVALLVLSVLPWGEFSNNRLKSFSLLSDLIPESDKSFVAHEEVDPALAMLDTITAAPVDSVTVALPETPLPEIAEDFDPPRSIDGFVLFEDYGSNLSRLKNFLEQSSSRPVRIAVLGDSYIEGDIFTQDVRSLLQDKYGGSGVGYMAAHSQFPGFRQSVRQSGDGWTEKDMRKIGSDPVKPLQGVYHVGAPGSKVTFKGTSKIPHADSWAVSRMLYIAPSDGTIEVDLGSDEQQEYQVVASPEVQELVCRANTSSFSVKSDILGLKVLGIWLETPTGIVLDCMSMRGNSGISHRHLGTDISAELHSFVPYDFIILEFGINALTSTQKDYSAYTSAMVEAVNRIKTSYPEAVIMIMGIGDRGQKYGTEVTSITTAPAMVKAQREIARRTGAIFWDTRAAMGGSGAAVEWNSNGLVNADYIHLNHKGGRKLAEIFINSLENSLSN